MNLHCREDGAGTPLVLLHGYLGGGAQWQRQMRAFPGARVIAPCLPGYGDSAHLSPPETVEGFARAVLNCLKKRNIARCMLLGHSMGGMIAQEIVRLAPENISALILYATGALGVLPGRFETMAESRRRLLEHGTEQAATRIPAKWLVKGENAGAKYRLAVRLAGLAALPAHLAGLAAMESWDGRAATQKIACPTLIVWGDLDQSYRREQIDFLHNNISESELTVIPGAGHLAHLEKPRQFNKIIKRFIAHQGI